MDQNQIIKLAVNALEDVKGKDIVVLKTEEITSLFDHLIVATGDSNRQVKALVRNVEAELKQNGFDIIGVEGLETGDWALVDAGDIVVHVMLAEVRNFYDIEALWGGEKPSSLANNEKPWNP